MKKQKGEFLVSSAILLAIFLATVFGAQSTLDERNADLQAKRDAAAAQEVKK